VLDHNSESTRSARRTCRDDSALSPGPTRNINSLTPWLAPGGRREGVRGGYPYFKGTTTGSRGNYRTPILGGSYSKRAGRTFSHTYRSIKRGGMRKQFTSLRGKSQTETSGEFVGKGYTVRRAMARHRSIGGLTRPTVTGRVGNWLTQMTQKKSLSRGAREPK